MSAPPARTDASLVTRGYLIALVSTAIWSTTAILIRCLTTRYAMPHRVLAFWSDLLVAAGLIAILLSMAGRVLVAGRMIWQSGRCTRWGLQPAC